MLKACFVYKTANNAVPPDLDSKKYVDKNYFMYTAISTDTLPFQISSSEVTILLFIYKKSFQLQYFPVHQ